MDEQIPQEPVISNPDTPQARPKWTLWLAIGGFVVFFCAAVFIGTLILLGPKVVQSYLPSNIQVAEEQPRAITQNNTMGDPNAPITIIEYGDYQCPYCLKFWRETEPRLIEEYVNTGLVYFEFRAFPIIGPESYTAAEGAYCAGDQGRFWEFHDTLFTNWTGENVGDFTADKLAGYAAAMDLDTAAFEQCLNEGKYKGIVEQDKANGEAEGVYATPTLLINGFKVEGAQPFEVLKQIIEDMLNGGLNTSNG